MKSSILNQYMNICSDVLSRMDTRLNKRFKEFILEVFLLYTIIPQKINFLQMGRYSNSGEQRFRQNFEKDFDWVGFNSELSLKILSGERKAIAINPCFIKKSGKKTLYIAKFWSGCHGKAMRGLEIMGVGLIDIDNKECVSLYAEQTPDTKSFDTTKWTLTDWYIFALNKQKKQLLKLSKDMVADAYFSKLPFVQGLDLMGFNLISRFRDDAAMYYIKQEQEQVIKKVRRPTIKNGKIDYNNNYSKFEKLDIKLDKGSAYTCIAWSVFLKRKVRLVIWISENGITHKLYFSTDISQSGIDVLEMYKTRFQIEFTYRDSKQYTGLCDSQARDLAKLKFNFNASLTCVNIAKGWVIKNKRPFSIASFKTMAHNAFMLQLFIDVSSIKPNKALIEKLFNEIVKFAVIAA